MSQKSFLIAIIAALFAPAFCAHAATLYWKDPSVQVRKGAQFETTMYLDTEGESINAVEGQVTFPAGALALTEIRDGGSVLNFWVEKPDVSAAKNGSFRFSGIIPGGFAGHDARLLSLVFTGTQEGGANVAPADIHAYRNDGAASEVSVAVNAFHADIRASAEASAEPSAPKDKEQPETFVPEVATDANLFGGRQFAVFDTVDKLSGIQEYQVLETKMSRSWLAIFSRWHVASSPYLLTDQSGSDYIFIKAVDRDGNARVERLTPAHPLAWYKNPNTIVDILFWMLMIAGIALGWKKGLPYLKEKFLHDVR